MNVANFTTLKVFPTLMKSVGLHGAMLIFAIPCTFGIFYVFFIIKETKGIALDAQKNDKNENTWCAVNVYEITKELKEIYVKYIKSLVFKYIRKTNRYYDQRRFNNGIIHF